MYRCTHSLSIWNPARSCNLQLNSADGVRPLGLLTEATYPNKGLYLEACILPNSGEFLFPFIGFDSCNMQLVRMQHYTMELGKQLRDRIDEAHDRLMADSTESDGQ